MGLIFTGYLRGRPPLRPLARDVAALRSDLASPPWRPKIWEMGFFMVLFLSGLTSRGWFGSGKSLVAFVQVHNVATWHHFEKPIPEGVGAEVFHNHCTLPA